MTGSLIEFMIPENSKGKATSAEQPISLRNVDEAKAAFKTACGRMHNVIHGTSRRALAARNFR